MDLINIPPAVQTGTVKPADVDVNSTLVLVGLKVNNKRNGTQWQEEYMTVADFAALTAPAIRTITNPLTQNETVGQNEVGIISGPLVPGPFSVTLTGNGYLVFI